MPNRGAKEGAGAGISLSLYDMVGLVSLGATMALICTGARIATERTDGWTRQLASRRSRRARSSRAKLSPVCRALLEMTALFLVGLLPFAALGVLVGWASPAGS